MKPTHQSHQLLLPSIILTTILNISATTLAEDTATIEEISAQQTLALTEKMIAMRQSLIKASPVNLLGHGKIKQLKIKSNIPPEQTDRNVHYGTEGREHAGKKSITGQ